MTNKGILPNSIVIDGIVEGFLLSGDVGEAISFAQHSFNQVKNMPRAPREFRYAVGVPLYRFRTGNRSFSTQQGICNLMFARGRESNDWGALNSVNGQELQGTLDSPQRASGCVSPFFFPPLGGSWTFHGAPRQVSECSGPQWERAMTHTLGPASPSFWPLWRKCGDLLCLNLVHLSQTYEFVLILIILNNAWRHQLLLCSSFLRGAIAKVEGLHLYFCRVRGVDLEEHVSNECPGQVVLNLPISGRRTAV